MGGMRFAKRREGFPASGIRALFDRARQIPDAIDLSIGQTDFDVPDPIKKATICAIQSGGGGYGPTQGDPELVQATKSYLQAKYGLAEDERCS